MIQKTSREVGIEPGTFEFIEVKYKCPGFDPHVGRFFVDNKDNNRLFLFFKIIYYGQFIALSKKFLWNNHYRIEKREPTGRGTGTAPSLLQ